MPRPTPNHTWVALQDKTLHPIVMDYENSVWVVMDLDEYEELKEKTDQEQRDKGQPDVPLVLQQTQPDLSRDVLVRVALQYVYDYFTEEQVHRIIQLELDLRLSEEEPDGEPTDRIPGLEPSPERAQPSGDVRSVGRAHNLVHRNRVGFIAFLAHRLFGRKRPSPTLPSSEQQPSD